MAPYAVSSPTLRPTQARSRTSLPILPRPASPIQFHLIPKPLSTQPSQTHLNPLRRRQSQITKVSHSPKTVESIDLATVQSPSIRDSMLYLQEEKDSLYKCTLCQVRLPPNTRSYTIPGTYLRSSVITSSIPKYKTIEGSGRVFCRACWTYIYDLAVCWTCGEIVGREDERVGFGWCWWHWACVSCMLCGVSRCRLQPPRIHLLSQRLLTKAVSHILETCVHHFQTCILTLDT